MIRINNILERKQKRRHYQGNKKHNISYMSLGLSLPHQQREKMATMNIDFRSFALGMLLFGLVRIGDAKESKLTSPVLCSQCSACDVSQCPASETYPHMTAWDDSLIAGALQSDYVKAHYRGVYSVPDIKGGQSEKYNSYFGWESTSGSASGYHRY